MRKYNIQSFIVKSLRDIPLPLSKPEVLDLFSKTARNCLSVYKCALTHILASFAGLENRFKTVGKLRL